MSSMFCTPAGHAERRVDALAQRAVARRRIRVARRVAGRRQRRDVLHEPADALLVGLRAVGDGRRRIDARGRGRRGSSRRRCRRCTTSRCWRWCRRRATVAVAGAPETRSGGSSKKLLDAAIAEAADSDVAPIWVTPAVSAACRLAAVAAGVAPMVNWLAPGVAEVVACSCNVCVVPSGRVKVKVTVSPLFGLLAPRSTEMPAGEPLGPVTVAVRQRRIDRRKLEAERRAGGILAHRDDRAGGRRDHQTAEPVGAEIGLLALGDHLREARLRRRCR